MERWFVFVLALAFVLLPRTACATENLLVFVGEKISLEKFEPEPKPGTISLDKAFETEYRVLEIIYGKYESDVVEFEIYDHHGRPKFEKYKNVLLFVSKDGDVFYHRTDLPPH